MADEQRLAGGSGGPVYRVGDTVRRVRGPWTPTVHRLLRALPAQGVAEVPRPISADTGGREVLSHLEGEVPHYPLPRWV